MATQSITFGDAVTYTPRSTNIQIANRNFPLRHRFSSDFNSVYFQSLVLYNSGGIELHLSSVSNDNNVAGLPDRWEFIGSLTIKVKSLSLTVRLYGGDTAEPYIWTPVNSQEVIDFVTAVRALSPAPSASDFTITLSDEPVPRRQEIILDRFAIQGGNRTYGSASSDPISPIFAGTNTRYLASVLLTSLSINVNLGPGPTSAGSTGEDLSLYYENNGWVRFSVGSISVDVNFANEVDKTEPYRIPNSSPNLLSQITSDVTSPLKVVFAYSQADLDEPPDLNARQKFILDTRTVPGAGVQYVPSGERPLIDKAFSGSNKVYSRIVTITPTGDIFCTFSPGLTGSDSVDLLPYFEDNGWIRLKVGSNVIDIDLSKQSDKDGPYTFTGLATNFYNQIIRISSTLEVTFAYSQSNLDDPSNYNVQLSQSYEAATASITPTLQTPGRDVSLRQVYNAAIASIKVEVEGGEVVVRQKICSTSRTGTSAYSFNSTERINRAFAGSLERYIRSFSIIANRIASLDLSDSATAGASNADLPDSFETGGWLLLEVGDESLTLDFSRYNDSAEPYRFSSSTNPAIATFSTAIASNTDDPLCITLANSKDDLRESIPIDVALSQVSYEGATASITVESIVPEPPYHTYTIVVGTAFGVTGYWFNNAGSITDATYQLPNGSDAVVRQTMIVGGEIRFVLNQSGLTPADVPDQFPERIVLTRGNTEVVCVVKSPDETFTAGQGIGRDYIRSSGDALTTVLQLNSTVTVQLYYPEVVEVIEDVTLSQSYGAALTSIKIDRKDPIRIDQSLSQSYDAAVASITITRKDPIRRDLTLLQVYEAALASIARPDVEVPGVEFVSIIATYDAAVASITVIHGVPRDVEIEATYESASASITVTHGSHRDVRIEAVYESATASLSNVFLDIVGQVRTGVRLTYTPGDNPIRDLVGNAIAAFTLNITGIKPESNRQRRSLGASDGLQGPYPKAPDIPAPPMFQQGPPGPPTAPETTSYPAIGDICKLIYRKYRVDDYTVVTGLDFLPEDIDNPRVNVTMRKVRNVPSA